MRNKQKSDKSIQLIVFTNVNEVNPINMGAFKHVIKTKSKQTKPLLRSVELKRLGSSLSLKINGIKIQVIKIINNSYGIFMIKNAVSSVK